MAFLFRCVASIFYHRLSINASHPFAFFAPCAEAGTARIQNRKTRAQATENCLRAGFLIYDTLSVRRSCSMRAPL